MLDGISPSSFWGTSWSFPAMNVWVEVIDPSYREDGMRKRCPNQSRRLVSEVCQDSDGIISILIRM